MAKKSTTAVKKTALVEKKEKPVLFYADRVKLTRAQIMVTKGVAKTVKEAYETLGGLFTDGYGVAPV